MLMFLTRLFYFQNLIHYQANIYKHQHNMLAHPGIPIDYDCVDSQEALVNIYNLELYLEFTTPDTTTGIMQLFISELPKDDAQFQLGQTRFWVSEEGYNQIYDAEHGGQLNEDENHFDFQWATREWNFSRNTVM